MVNLYGSELWETGLAAHSPVTVRPAPASLRRQRLHMRITISHSKGQQQMIQTVDRAFDDVFRGLVPGPLTISGQQKVWEGSVMKFSLIARMGFIKNPISGTVEVTERDVTIDADLGMLGNLIPTPEVRSNLETRFRKLLT
jgi:hypothetical protein